MKTILITVATALLTSGLTSGVIIHFLETRRQHREEKKKKTEETYLLAMKTADKFRRAVRASKNYKDKMISENQYLEICQEFEKFIYTEDAVGKLRMNISLYFPLLKPKMINVAESYLQFSCLSKKSYQNLGNDPQISIELETIYNNYNNAVDDFLSAIEKEAV